MREGFVPLAQGHVELAQPVVDFCDGQGVWTDLEDLLEELYGLELATLASLQDPEIESRPPVVGAVLQR